MDKTVLKFIADVLYLKGILCVEEIEDILDASNGDDLEVIFDKMFRGDYNVYKRGEVYTNYTPRS